MNTSSDENTALINYDGRRFRAIENSEAGEVGGDTVFEYRQMDAVVWGTYSGGSIRFGTLVAKVAPDASLDMRYQHVNDLGVLCTGQCQSRAEILPDGRIRLHESWQWTSGRDGTGTSILEEVRYKNKDSTSIPTLRKHFKSSDDRAPAMPYQLDQLL